MEPAQKHTCLKLELAAVAGSKSESVFVKGTWNPTNFDLSITDGLNAWICHATEEEVNERASQWDQTVTDYIDLAERYLGFQQPGSDYGFSDAGSGSKRKISAPQAATLVHQSPRPDPSPLSSSNLNSSFAPTILIPVIPDSSHCVTASSKSGIFKPKALSLSLKPSFVTNALKQDH